MVEGSDPRWKALPFLVFGGFCIRVLVALISENIYYPDELFQVLEQAHRLTFGYGIIPWEFRFAARSWIVPGFIIIWLWPIKYLKLDNPHFYIPLIKIIFCFLSVSLIYYGYQIGRNLASEKAGRLAAVLICFWYELIYLAHKPLTDILSTYLLIAALACAVMKVSSARTILFGILAGLCVVIRLQQAAPVAFLILYVLFKWKIKNVLLAAGAFLVVILFAGALDWYMWGEFLLSYYNYYLYNVVYGALGRFGKEPIYWYLWALTIASSGMFAVTVLLSFNVLRKAWVLLILSGIILIFYSYFEHKEYRFVLSCVPLLLILLSIVLVEREENSKEKRQPGWVAIGVSLFAVISLAGLFYRLPFEKNIYKVAPLKKQDTLEAYLSLYKESDLVAVLEASEPWYATGGYYYLHRDVPIYYPPMLPGGLLNQELTSYVSHIICRSDQKEIPGFYTATRIGSLEIRKQLHSPTHYKNLEGYSRNVLQKGIDNRFQPTVKPRF